ncbi:MAG: hypothetical protein WC863_04490 [Patescibacteria group bacterium]
MKIGNIDVTSCSFGSGSLSFFGNGYWYSHWLKFLIPEFKEILDSTTFVAKTATLDPREGHMALDENFQPRELIPKCIKVYPFKGVIQNAVGLSNPGFNVLLRTRRWQEITRPFFLSFITLRDTPQERIDEAKKFFNILENNLPNFKAPVGLQINVSCPNTQHDTRHLAEEALTILYLASRLNIPLDLKINILVSADLITEIEKSGFCDSLTVSNTLPYGSPGVDWKKLFGRDSSPLQQFGGGGLSGKPILPLVLWKILNLRSAGITLPIRGSGGILSVSDVDRMKAAGASAIEISSVLILRPWRVPAIIKRANQIF